MSRAARRRAEREAAKGPQKTPQLVKLENPVANQYEAFIFGNALVAEQSGCVVEDNMAAGQTIVICGAGPSLPDDIDDWAGKADQLWGANSALMWLHDRGYPVTHGITVDQTPAMLTEWYEAPEVEYLVASTIHPHLTEHLLARGRSLRWFHNFVGIKKPPVEWCACGHDDGPGHCVQCDCTEYRPRMMSYEDWLYMTLYPPTVRVGSGLNTVTRAIDVALVMGAARVVVLGADCALRVKRPLPANVRHGSAAHKAWLQNDTVMHADGGNALASGATPVTLGGYIDGRWWETKPDMAITAVFMHRMRQALGDRLILVGDTLPNALRGKSDAFINALPTLLDSDGNPIRVALTDPLYTGDVLTTDAAPT